METEDAIQSLTLEQNQVHLWLLSTDDPRVPECLHEARGIIDSAEREQERRFRFVKDQRRFVMTRAMRRRLLSMYAPGVRPENWTFKENKYGCPSIDRPGVEGDLNFNMSHTAGLIVAAVTKGRRVGVDVEAISRQVDLLSIAKSVFAPREYSELKLRNGEDRTQRFYTLWTLKEAYIKACGMGLSIPLSEFWFTFPTPETITIDFDPIRNDVKEHWKLWQFRPTTDHLVSLALHDDSKSPGQTPAPSVYQMYPSGRVQEAELECIRTSGS